MQLVGGLLPAEEGGELEEGEGHRGGVRGPAAPAATRGGLEALTGKLHKNQCSVMFQKYFTF